MVSSLRHFISQLSPCQVRVKRRQLATELIKEVNAGGLHARGAFDRLDTLASRSEELTERCSSSPRIQRPLRSWKRRS